MTGIALTRDARSAAWQAALVDSPTASPAEPRIDVMRPWLGEEEAAAVVAVIASGWVAQGPRVAEFEERFAAIQQAEHAVATSSCTTALHLALVVAGIGPGDDVVVPSFSFIATANAPTYVGARPVFADVCEHTGNITALTVERVLTPRTRAVIVVDQGGLPADIEPIRRLCERRGIVVIEDAACGVGSTYRGRPVGVGADVTAWSFHPRKILTTGEGGMLTTPHADWAGRARRLREHAMSAGAAERHTSVLAPQEEYLEIGFNHRMTDLQAAVGIVQLGRLAEVIARRRELAAAYTAALAGAEGLRVVRDPTYGTSNFQSFWVEVLDSYPWDRDQVLAALASAGVSARRGIMATHLEIPYRRHPGRVVMLPVTERLSRRTLILPLFHTMTTDEQSRVIEVLLSRGATA